VFDFSPPRPRAVCYQEGHKKKPTNVHPVTRTETAGEFVRQIGRRIDRLISFWQHYLIWNLIHVVTGLLSLCSPGYRVGAMLDGELCKINMTVERCPMPRE
jgi:hypothetical protein